MNPPLPSEISAFEPPSPSEFPVTFRGGGMDIFWNHTFKCALYVEVILNQVNKLSKSRKYSRSCLCFCHAKEPVIYALWPQNKVNAMKIFFKAIRMCSQYYTWFYLLCFFKENIHLSEMAQRKLVCFAGKKPPLDSLKAIKNLI